jgi:hypothetical protein
MLNENIKAISEKLEVINLQLAQRKETRRKIFVSNYYKFTQARK